MDAVIKNQSDLRAEILRLETLERERVAAIKQHFSGPGAIFSTVTSLFTGSGGSDKGIKIDVLSLISRVAIPFALNRTLFRKSGFIIKTLVGLVSQKASGYISEDSVTGVWQKAKGWVGKLLHKDEKPAIPSYKKINKD